MKPEVLFCLNLWCVRSRRLSRQSESFSPQVDAHSMKLAEAVYEQTRGLGPTPLQGRLNYLHQLGKLTLRDRSASLLNLPQRREDIEFAVSASLGLFSALKGGAGTTDSPLHAC